MSDFELVAQAIFSQFYSIANAYMSSVVLGGVIALFLFRKVVDVLDKIMP